MSKRSNDEPRKRPTPPKGTMGPGDITPPKMPDERSTPPPVSTEPSASSTSHEPSYTPPSTSAGATTMDRPMTTPHLPDTFDFNAGFVDLRTRRVRDRSVLAVQPPTETPDGFVAKAIAQLAKDAGGADKTQAVTAALLREGLSEDVAKATSKLNLGGIDRIERLLLSTTPIYATLLEQAMGSPGVEVADVPEVRRRRRRVDFDDTVGLVNYLLRTLNEPNGFRHQLATQLVEEVLESKGLQVPDAVKSVVIRDVTQREMPLTARKVEDIIVPLITERRSTLAVQAAVDEYARSKEVDPTRFTPAVRRSMISFLTDLGVAFPPGGITPANRAQFDEYFALAYNHALRTADGASADPIDAVRQKGAITSWDFTVDTFETVEEMGVVPANILAAGALDYIYNLGERLGIFRLADGLVLRWASGAFDADPGKPSADLYRYWKLRSERLSPEERAMMYRRILAKGEGNLLSGMVENEAFPELWGGLMERVTDYIRRSEENASSDRTVSRQPIYQATKQLQYNLTEHATGMAHMQITEMYHHLLEARQVLEHAIDYFSTGSRKSLWTVIERASREWFGEAPNIAAIRSAAVDGNRVFQWIAEFEQSSVTDDQFQRMLEAAEAWIIATATDESEPSFLGGEQEDEEDIGDIEKEFEEIGSDWDN